MVHKKLGMRLLRRSFSQRRKPCRHCELREAVSKMSLFLLLMFSFFSLKAQQQDKDKLDSKIKHYVDYFNTIDKDTVQRYVADAEALNTIKKLAPAFECPDTLLERTYYYRWYSFLKHLTKTPEGFIFTEFITPVKHAGKYNSISCATGHHIYEGRWLDNTEYLKEYVKFWLYKADVGQTKQRFHQFSSWIDDAIYQNYLIKKDLSFIKEIFPALDADFEKWEKERKLKNGLFWQHDVKDGMEESVSGSRRDQNSRPTINSYMYGNAIALRNMAQLLGNVELEQKYQQKASELYKLTTDSLWDKNASFYKTKLAKGPLANAREAIGFIPWAFHLAPDKSGYAQAWSQLTDTAGFNAPWGLTTAERREPTFRTRGTGHSCEWDGALWPFATSQTLKGLANLLTDYKNHGEMSKAIFYDEVHKYAYSQQMDGKPYIGEYQDEKTGAWLKGDDPRSKYYNHSTFCDIIINDLIGLKPQADETLLIKPLLPEGKWDWFALNDVSYHGKKVSVVWDKTGNQYQKGKGLLVFVDGKLVKKSNKLKDIKVKI